MIARSHGSIVAVESSRIVARIAGASIGDEVTVRRRAGGVLQATVSALHADRAVLAPLDGCERLALGDAVQLDGHGTRAVLGLPLLGRAVDACGASLDGKARPRGRLAACTLSSPPPSERAAITDPLWTSVRAVDGLLTIGRGARIGLFGSPGVGKSTLLETIAAHARCDAIVLGLVGERGRESAEWIARCAPHMTIVSETADRPAAARVRAAVVAAAHAARLRALGLHVLLVLDSVARFGYALREVALASGEPVGRGGYPPSVFAKLAELLETGGVTRSGSVTILASVLIDGDERDPLAEAAQSLMDGHIVLGRSLAARGHFPAIDVPASMSRTMGAVTTNAHRHAAGRVREALASLWGSRDARELGLAPADALGRAALAAEKELDAFLRQGPEASDPAHTLRLVGELADTFNESASVE